LWRTAHFHYAAQHSSQGRARYNTVYVQWGFHRLQGLASADFVIEAVRESEDIKRSVFMRLDQVTRPFWGTDAYAAESKCLSFNCDRPGAGLHSNGIDCMPRLFWSVFVCAVCKHTLPMKTLTCGGCIAWFIPAGSQTECRGSG